MTLRGWARLGAIALWLGVCLPMWAITSRFGGGGPWVRRFLGGTGRILGMRVRTEGRPVAGPVLYVANHITLLDILALGGIGPVRFIAKDEIAGWALVGSLARVADTIFVSRERRGEARAQADLVAAALAGARPVVLFGEGATGDGTALMPFRAPLFVSAIEARVPVQPVAIDYGPQRVRHAWPDDVSFGREAKRLLARAGTIPVVLRFLDPITAGSADRKALAAAAQAAIGGALAEADRITPQP